MRFSVFLFLLFSLFCTSAFSQYEEVRDSVTAVAPEEIFLESDSLVRTAYVTDNALYPKKLAPNYKNRYKGPEYNYTVQKPQESIWDLIKRKIAQLLFKNIDPNKAAIYTINLLRFFGIVLLGILVFVLVKYLLSKEGNFLFGRKNRKIKIAHQDIEENIHEINFPARILQLEKQKDYRSAIRYHFLYALKKLADKSLIQWNPEKTNHDYLKELKSADLRGHFSRVIYIYDYIWYGEFATGEKDYLHYKKYFNKF